MSRLVLLLFLLCFCSLSQSFSLQLNDSIRAEARFLYRPKLVLGLDGHNSLVAGQTVKIGGVRLGLEFKRKLRLGCSFNYLNPPVYRETGTNTDQVFYRIKFHYFGIFGDYVLLNNRYWELSVPLLLGAGRTVISSKSDANEQFQYFKTAKLNVIQASVVGYYKVFRWLGAGASIGYRNVISDDKNAPELSKIVREAFDGPNWAIKLKLYLGELYQTMFKPEKKVNIKTVGEGNP